MISSRSRNNSLCRRRANTCTSAIGKNASSIIGLVTSHFVRAFRRAVSQAQRSQRARHAEVRHYTARPPSPWTICLNAAKWVSSGTKGFMNAAVINESNPIVNGTRVFNIMMDADIIDQVGASARLDSTAITISKAISAISRSRGYADRRVERFTLLPDR